MSGARDRVREWTVEDFLSGAVNDLERAEETIYNMQDRYAQAMGLVAITIGEALVAQVKATEELRLAIEKLRLTIERSG